jgi:hypothetical protein
LTFGFEFSIDDPNLADSIPPRHLLPAPKSQRGLCGLETGILSRTCHRLFCVMFVVGAIGFVIDRHASKLEP